MTHTEALMMALEALERTGNIKGFAYDREQRAITAIKEAFAQPEQRNLTEQEHDVLVNSIKASSTVVSKGFLAQPQQEPVAWLTEERYAEMHTSKWTPKIQQVFSKDGILESQTIQYAPQSKPVSYPPAQRTWQGLTDEELRQIWYDDAPVEGGTYIDKLRQVETKLKEKNDR